MNNLGSISLVSTSLYLAWDTIEKLYGSEYAKSMLAEVRKLFIIQQITGTWISGDIFVTKKTRDEAVAFFKELSGYTVRGAPLPIRAMIMSDNVYASRLVTVFAEQYSLSPCLFAVTTGAGSFHAWIGESVSLERLYPDNLSAIVVRSQVDRDTAEVIMARESSVHVKEILTQRVTIADALRRMGYAHVTTLMPVNGAQEIIPGYYGIAPSKLDIDIVIDRALERFTAKQTVTVVETPHQPSYAIFEKLEDGN